MEQEPQEPSIEARALTRLGYGHCLDLPLGPDASITGKNFLSMYQDEEKRRHTQDLLEGFMDMDPSDPDYEATKVYLGRFIEPFFGTAQT